MKDRIEKLNSLIPQMKADDASFAASLIAAFYKYGKLTPKQEPWVQKVIDKYEKPQNAPVVKKTAVGDMSGVIALFDKAAQKLKYPAIVLSLDGYPVRISRAAPDSKNPGWLYVKMDGQYLGKISPAGDALYFDDQGVLGLLAKLAADPAGTAAAYGHLTGKCCFCNSPLTDPKSTEVGYGPVCAKHYGLPHGTPKLADVHQHIKVLAAEADALVPQGLKAFPELLHLAEGPDNMIEFEQEQQAEKAERRKIEFDKTPGQAVKNLMGVLYGQASA